MEPLADCRTEGQSDYRVWGSRDLEEAATASCQQRVPRPPFCHELPDSSCARGVLSADRLGEHQSHSHERLSLTKLQKLFERLNLEPLLIS